MDPWLAWFSGFFDGEGSIQCLALKERKVVLLVCISQREIRPLRAIQERLGGQLYEPPKKKPGQWNLRGAPALAETIVPIFDAYPLQTKKGEEWALVKPLILERLEIGRYMTREFWEKAAEVSAELSRGRATWEHLRVEREWKEQRPLGRPKGVVETRPRRARGSRTKPGAGSSTASKTG